MDNRELYHYGILGMKWGVRRTPEQLGHKPTLKERAQAHEERTRQRDEARQAKVKRAIDSYKTAAQNHENKTRQRDLARQQKVHNAVSSYKAKTQAHEERTRQHDAARNEKLRSGLSKTAGWLNRNGRTAMNALTVISALSVGYLMLREANGSSAKSQPKLKLVSNGKKAAAKAFTGDFKDMTMDDLAKLDLY